MDEKLNDNKQDDNPYTQEEYEKDLAHSDVVSYYQRKLTKQLGHQVTLSEAEYVAYALDGTGLWRLLFYRNTITGSIESSKVLEGVAFYQIPLTTILRCHWQRSIGLVVKSLFEPQG